MKDIAEVLGLHPSSVSLAMRDSPRIARATKERIHAQALSMGYRPDPELTLYNTKRHTANSTASRGCIAFIIDQTPPELGGNWSRELILDGLRSQAAAMGYTVDLFHLGKTGYSGQQLKRILLARGIRGVVFAMPLEQTGGVLPEAGPFLPVWVGATNINNRMDSFAPDYHQGARLSLRALRQLGYLRPGLVCRGSLGDEYFMTGYYAEYASQGIQWPHPPFVGKEWNNTDLLALERWFGEGNYDALMCADPNFALRLGTGFLARLGSPPFVCLDKPDTRTDLAGINSNWRTVGAEVMKSLYPMLHRDMNRSALDSSSTTYIPVGWCEGPSVCPKSTRLFLPTPS